MIIFNFSEPNSKRQKMDSLSMDLNGIIKSINDYFKRKEWECELTCANFKDIKSLEDAIARSSRAPAFLSHREADDKLQGSSNWERFCLYLTHDKEFRTMVLDMFCQELQLYVNSMVSQGLSNQKE